MQSDKYQPQETESLGQYLKRLRRSAGRVQGRSVTQDQVAALSQRSPAAPQQQFTDSWLSKVEADRYKQVGGDRLRALAAIFSELLQTSIPAEWLLNKAGFVIDEPTRPVFDRSALDNYLSHDEILVMVGICGQLMENGYDEDVKLLIRLAARYLDRQDGKTDPANLFDDPKLSAHVRKSMEVLGL